MSTLPPGWTEATVGEVAESIQTGFASGEHNRNGRGIPHIRPMNIGRDGRLTLADLRYVEAADGHRLRRGDILFNNTNSAELVGKTTWIDNDRELAFSNHMTRVRVSAAFSAEFIARQLHHLWSRGSFQLLCNNHVSQASISARTLAEKIRLYLPPSAEQTRIVTRIGQLTARSRRAKESLDAVPPLLDKLRQSILAAAFRGDLTSDWRAKNPDVEPADKLLARIRAERRARWESAELARLTARGKPPSDDRWKAKYVEPEKGGGDEPAGLPDTWAWSSLGELFDIGIGATPSRTEASYWGGNVPWVSSGEVAFCRLSKTRESITEEGLANTSTEVHPAGTVLIGMIGEGKTRGQAAILDIPACNNQNSAAIRVSETPVPPEYVYQYLALVYEQTRRAGSGNNQQALNKSRVQALTIPVAPLAEQRELVQRLKRWLERVDAAETAVDDGFERVAALNQSLLAKAFRGELVPQDPKDEPAAVLLDRIRTRRGEASNVRRPRSTPLSEEVTVPAPVEPRAVALPVPAPSVDPDELKPQAFAALWLHGPLEKDAAVRRLADHVRDAGQISFQRLRADGPLYAQLSEAIEAAVRAGHLDRPKRGQVRACKPDATAYTADDWRHALLAVLGPSPTDREDAIRAAAEWARDNCGLEFTRLRADGHIVTGLRSALNSAIRAKHITRIDATHIARAPDSPTDRQTTLFADDP